MEIRQAGHVYILTSPKTEFVKIGGTYFPPLKRIREINAASTYRELGEAGAQGVGVEAEGREGCVQDQSQFCNWYHVTVSANRFNIACARS